MSDTEEKEYDLDDTTLIFVKAKDSINPDCENQRAQMSCGHAVTAESLSRWFAIKLLDDLGLYKLKCPACKAKWEYSEVRRLAALTPDEMRKFERIMENRAAKLFCNYKACPGCGTFVEREAFNNLCFICTICKEKNLPNQQFCWQCLKPWKGRAPRSDHCDNDDCSDKDLDLLKGCGEITLSDVKGVGPVPSIRACPTCGLKVEHDKTNCKNILCPRCHVEFCFVCLKLTRECHGNSSYYGPCSIAPRQTAIPIWNRK